MTARKIEIVGAGSLGSFTALHIAKMAGVLPSRITVYDHDKVERHNLLNQLYRESDIGKYKVDALQDVIKGLTGLALDPLPIKIDASFATCGFHGIMIVLVDTMTARKEIFEMCKNQADIPFYIEARSGNEGALVYALDPRDPDATARYEKTLYAQENAVQAPCAEQRTVPNLWFVAATIARILARYAAARIPKLEFIEVVVNTERLPIIASKAYNY